MSSHTYTDCQIENVSVIDLRVPTSDTLLGSDPFHKKPNYSAVLTTIETNTGHQGVSVAFHCRGRKRLDRLRSKRPCTTCFWHGCEYIHRGSRARFTDFSLIIINYVGLLTGSQQDGNWQYCQCNVGSLGKN